jgi:hypothetical protein
MELFGHPYTPTNFSVKEPPNPVNGRMAGHKSRFELFGGEKWLVFIVSPTAGTVSSQYVIEYL